MRTIKVEKTIEEIKGYEAADGKFFKTEEECKAYEDTAEFIINQDFLKVCVKNKTLAEAEIYQNYGYGSDEYNYAIVDVKDVNVLEIVNRFLKTKKIPLIDPSYIGKKILIEIGGLYVGYAEKPNPKTMDDLVNNFIKDMNLVFEDEYLLDKVLKDRAEYMLKDAIKYYESDCYTNEDLINKVKEIYEMIK